MSITLENLKNKTRKSTAAALIEDNKPKTQETPQEQQKEAATADQGNSGSAGELAGTSTTEKIGRQSDKMFEEEFSRQTFYVHNDLMKKINKLSKNKKGFKTKLINAALEKYLNETN